MCGKFNPGGADRTANRTELDDNIGHKREFPPHDGGRGILGEENRNVNEIK
jgi:hypothetical protein